VRTRTLTGIAGTATAAVLALTGCSSSSSHDNASPAPTTPAAAKTAKTVDCSDQSLSQADWMAHCASKTDASGSLNRTFGQTYTWSDGIKATIVSATVFTAYDKSLDEHATPGETDFRLRIRITNNGRAPLDLSALSTIINGATNGGQAASTTFNNGSAPLEGLLAPGVTTVKTDDDSLKTAYGRKIAVTLQRTTPGSIDLMPSPVFAGTITG
jgi:hypothetical protein